MKFIKLTGVDDVGEKENSVWVNMEIVSSIERYYKFKYSRLVYGTNLYTNVKETPEEIIEIIKDLK